MLRPCQSCHLGRKVAIVNLDPGNENMNYKPAVDVSEVVTVEDVMEAMKLGPNGSLMFAMQFVRYNLEWLDSKLDSMDLDTLHHEGTALLFCSVFLHINGLRIKGHFKIIPF